MSATVKHIISLTDSQVEIVEVSTSFGSSLEITVIPLEGVLRSVSAFGETTINRRKKLPVKSLTGENLSKSVFQFQSSYTNMKSKSTKGD